MERKPKRLGLLSDLAALSRLVRAWANGRYRKLPWPTLLAMAAGVVYFVSPIDLVPDFIPLIGYLDDATVLALVLRAIRRDLGHFSDWEQAQPATS